MPNRYLIALTLLAAACAPTQAAPKLTTRRLANAAPTGYIEIRGVKAGPFSPSLWQKGALHFVPDLRAPILEPRPGSYRNIYAPSIVDEGTRFRVYYGGWDGTDSGNDRIFTATADRDFLDWGPRSMVVDHGAFIHVNNCSAVRSPDGSVSMLATCFPVGENTNKPALFTSPTGSVFNGAPEYAAKSDDLVSLDGYGGFAKSDINGMNVLYRDGPTWRMYFCDFTQFGQVYRASSTDARHWTFDGPAVKAAMMANDVKSFRVDGKTWLLMLLHHNGDSLAQSLSTDSAHFPEPHTLMRSLGASDRYMVACGLVSDGKTAYGVLYGAGAVKSLDQNRIFARWLQKRVVFKMGAVDVAAAARAFGPDRLRIALPSGISSVSGTLSVYSEDGITLIGRSTRIALRDGDAVTVVTRQPGNG